MYKSPITLTDRLVSEITKKQDDQITAAVRHEININIDKEELIKVLKYDRDQYDQGYKDGYQEGYKSARDKFLDILNYSISHTISDAITDALKRYDENYDDEPNEI